MRWWGHTGIHNGAASSRTRKLAAVLAATENDAIDISQRPEEWPLGSANGAKNATLWTRRCKGDAKDATRARKESTGHGRCFLPDTWRMSDRHRCRCTRLWSLFNRRLRSIQNQRNMRQEISQSVFNSSSTRQEIYFNQYLSIFI